MAIVNGRRVPGLEFFKKHGTNYWLAIIPQAHPGYRHLYRAISPCAEVDTLEDPRTERFHYCSITSQPVFLDESMTDGGWGAKGSGWTPSSWAKMPEGWRAAFYDYFKEEFPQIATPKPGAKVIYLPNS